MKQQIDKLTVHFDFVVAVVLVTFDEDEVDRRHVGEQLFEVGFLCPRQFVHQGPALARCDHNLGGAGGTVAVGIFARLVDVEDMVGVLYGGNGIAERGDLADQLDQ